MTRDELANAAVAIGQSRERLDELIRELATVTQGAIWRRVILTDKG